MQYPGKLITFEGLDGCGKSTQLAREAKRLSQRGIPVTATHEPGGTKVGQHIREIVLHAASGAMTSFTELALMFAARAQHVEEVIVPALQSSRTVLCDRFTDSSVAYQGYGRGISLEVIQALEKSLCRGIRPDLTIFLDIDPEIGAQRTDARNRAASEKESRFEQEGLEFFERVRQGYRRIAEQEQKRVRIVDGRGSVAEVHAHISSLVDQFLEVSFPRSRNGV
ncbi:MAG: dTMP kinase [Acidobacteria bacterium]|nr:dTMP kinase [Acidobacteriota bacterium]